MILHSRRAAPLTRNRSGWIDPSGARSRASGSAINWMNHPVQNLAPAGAGLRLTTPKASPDSHGKTARFAVIRSSESQLGSAERVQCARVTHCPSCNGGCHAH